MNYRILQIKTASLFILAIASGSAAQAAPSLLVNGGFEQPVAPPGAFLTFTAASQGLTGFTINSGSVDLLDQFAPLPPASGNQNLDLDGNNPGAISQTFATTVGQSYNYSFVYGNNYAAGAIGSIPATADVSLSGLVFGDLLNQSISHASSSAANMNYTPFFFNFIANSASTTLEIASTDRPSSFGGIVLDSLAVVPAPEISAGSALTPLTLCFFSLLLLADRRRATIS